MEQARQDVETSGATPSGRVSVAIAPYSMASSLAPQIISEVNRRYPDVVVHLTEIYGGVLSEAIKNGRLDMALIYEPGPIRGVQFTTMIVEDLYLVVSPEAGIPADVEEITLSDVAGRGLFLPEQIHTLRQIVERGFEESGLRLRLMGEVESVPSLARLLRANLGAAILPRSAADALFHDEDFQVLRITGPGTAVKDRSVHARPRAAFRGRIRRFDYIEGNASEHDDPEIRPLTGARKGRQPAIVPPYRITRNRYYSRCLNFPRIKETN